jgi:hypothetical protein
VIVNEIACFDEHDDNEGGQQIKVAFGAIVRGTTSPLFSFSFFETSHSLESLQIKAHKGTNKSPTNGLQKTIINMVIRNKTEGDSIT